MAKLQSRSAADLRTEIDRILETEPDADRAKAAVDAMLDVERLIIDRERAERDEERLERERRRFVNPILVALAAGVLAIAGDAYISQQQGRQELELARERAQSDLIRSAFVGEVDQTIANLNFMIDAGLIQDPDQAIIAAAEENEPRESPTRGGNEWVTGVFERPISRIGTIDRVIDGDSLRVRFDHSFGSGPRPSQRSDGTVTVSLAGVDAAERFAPGCRNRMLAASAQIGRTATEAVGTYEGRQMRFMFVEVGPFGRLYALVAPSTRAPEDLMAVYAQSINRDLVRSGLAMMAQGGTLPAVLTDRIRSDAKESRAAKQGMWADVVAEVDLDAEVFPPLSPWLLRRACLMAADTDPKRHLEAYFANYEARDAATGRVLDPTDILRVEGRRVTQLRPVHSFNLLRRP